MAVLEQVMQMKEKGFSESEIAQYLKDNGVDPKEINDALSQSKIKSELTRESAYQEQVFPETYQTNSGEYSQGTQQTSQEYQMQPSIMLNREKQELVQQPMQQVPSSFETSTKPYEESYQYPQDSQGEYYPEYSQQSDIETMNEIAQQIVEEKNSKIKKQIVILTNFKEEINAEMERINQRLERIENSFDNLQASIIRKIGDYGEDIKNIAKEMHSTQESFSKIINPLADNARKSQPEEVQNSEPKPRKSKKSEPAANFEDYLR
jgi:hypothetical protein